MATKRKLGDTETMSKFKAYLEKAQKYNESGDDHVDVLVSAINSFAAVMGKAYDKDEDKADEIMDHEDKSPETYPERVQKAIGAKNGEVWDAISNMMDIQPGEKVSEKSINREILAKANTLCMNAAAEVSEEEEAYKDYMGM